MKKKRVKAAMAVGFVGAIFGFVLSNIAAILMGVEENFALGIILGGLITVTWGRHVGLIR